MTKPFRHALGALALILLACMPLGACTSSTSPIRPVDQLAIAYTAASAGVLAYSLSGYADPEVVAKLSLARDVAGAALANLRALDAQEEVDMIALHSLLRMVPCRSWSGPLQRRGRSASSRPAADRRHRFYVSAQLKCAHPNRTRKAEQNINARRPDRPRRLFLCLEGASSWTEQ